MDRPRACRIGNGRVLAVLALLALACRAAGQAPVLPDKLAIAPNRLSSVVIQTNGLKVQWKLFGGEVDSFREYDPDPNRIALRLIGYKEGTAYLLCWGAKGDTPTEGTLCTITVGTPAPSNGGPPDALTFALTSAYKSETDGRKADYLAYLSAICAGMSGRIDAAATVGDLFTAFSAVLHADGLGNPRGSLPLVMRVVGDKLNAALGTDAAKALDKNAAKDAFATLAKSLKGVH